jgi:hypothetical protein
MAWVQIATDPFSTITSRALLQCDEPPAGIDTVESSTPVAVSGFQQQRFIKARRPFSTGQFPALVAILVPGRFKGLPK